MMDKKDEKTDEKICWRCGKVLQAGGLNYVIQIRVYADFNGVLVEPEEGIDTHLERLLDQIEISDPKQLEKEVYEEFSIIVCKSCRDRFVDEIEHPWGGPFKIRKDPDRYIH